MENTHSNIENLLTQTSFTREDIIRLLSLEGEERTMLLAKSREIKEATVGKKVYFRGLVEFSNICAKNCLYCGIRLDNKVVNRFRLTEDEIVQAARFAHENRYGSIVLQSGEVESEEFTSFVESVLTKIAEQTRNELRVTLSCGEQSKAVYTRWRAAGAHRYLLRIETSSADLYAKYHPADARHSHDRRLQCLDDLRESGFQLGTGVMIGLPYQAIGDLADDLLFMKTLQVDMVGMGPYLEHENTPLFQHKDVLLPVEKRFDLALKMIAVLRIMMPDINIAAATALQAVDPLGREKAIKIGANVIMPNITPGLYRNSYKLYENKPCTDEKAEDCKNCLEVRISLSENEIAWGQWGDSAHYQQRQAD